MMRRRPIARMAVRTTVVAGTAAAVGAHAANKRAASGAGSRGPRGTTTSAASARTCGGRPDPIEQLTQLAALKDSGALTRGRVRDAEGPTSWVVGQPSP